jgi:hypothetical protein
VWLNKKILLVESYNYKTYGDKFYGVKRLERGENDFLA